MVMSQGTYTFLACLAGFWLVWALVVMLCCFCSFVQRRLKRRRQEQLRERCLRSLELEPLQLHCASPSEPPRCCPPQAPPPRPPSAWTSTQEADPFGKPPCYEEAVLMEDPPPPYSEVLSDPRGGTYAKPAPGTTRKPQETKPSKAGPEAGFPERAGFSARAGFSSLIHLPEDERWDSLDRLLSAIDLNRTNRCPAQAPPLAPLARTSSELGLTRLPLDPCALPTAFPLFGRSTAV